MTPIQPFMEQKLSDTPEKPVAEDKLRQGIEAIFSSITRESEKKARERLEARKDDPDIIAAGEALDRYDYEKFDYGYLMPFRDQTRAIIGTALRNDYRLQFLFGNADFVSAHLKNLFTRYEGYSCCVDKTRTVMRALARFYHLDKPIRFNYEATYTYSLPQRILKDHDSIVAFFESLQLLHNGYPDEYLEQMRKFGLLDADKSAEL
nr:hypothetical protein [Neorhizobium tomejilense]